MRCLVAITAQVPFLPVLWNMRPLWPSVHSPLFYWPGCAQHRLGPSCADTSTQTARAASGPFPQSLAHRCFSEALSSLAWRCSWTQRPHQSGGGWLGLTGAGASHCACPSALILCSFWVIVIVFMSLLPPGTAIVTEEHAAMWTDGRYFLQAAKQMDSNWTLMKMGV